MKKPAGIIPVAPARFEVTITETVQTKHVVEVDRFMEIKGFNKEIIRIPKLAEDIFREAEELARGFSRKFEVDILESLAEVSEIKETKDGKVPKTSGCNRGRKASSGNTKRG